ncbi:MAG: ABC transporter permease, partial [Phototrophicaceae bacterium]
DNIITGISFVLFSMPVFLLALLLVQVFAVQFKHLGLPYLPVSGMYDPRGDRSIDELVRHLILPVASLAAISIAGYSRYIRATMLEVINSDYIRTARAKGLSERRITFLHALKNASLPLVTLVALDVPFLLGGAVITETIFSWPGMGTAFIEALRRPDMFLIISFVLMTAVAVVVFQIIADIVYSWLDPRIRYN